MTSVVEGKPLLVTNGILQKVQPISFLPFLLFLSVCRILCMKTILSNALSDFTPNNALFFFVMLRGNKRLYHSEPISKAAR